MIPVQNANQTWGAPNMSVPQNPTTQQPRVAIPPMIPVDNSMIGLSAIYLDVLCPDGNVRKIKYIPDPAELVNTSPASQMDLLNSRLDRIEKMLTNNNAGYNKQNGKKEGNANG